MKRRAALLRSLNRSSDAVAALIQLLDAVPTDAEAWCELADLYQSQGLGSQAIFSLEEALLIAPNAWNVRPVAPTHSCEIGIDLYQIHARLGELLYICASSADGEARRLAGKSVQHFCRSIELCDDYLRGLYGLILVCERLCNIIMPSGTDRTLLPQASSRMLENEHASESPSDPAIPSKKTIAGLKSFALQRLDHIIQSRSLDDQHWASNSSELIAAKELLNRFEKTQ